jgi:hypothetical protein
VGHSAGIREQQLRSVTLIALPKYGQIRRFDYGRKNIGSNEVIEGLRLNLIGQIGGGEEIA